MPLWQLLEYMETVMEYYGVKHEGLSFDRLARKYRILDSIRKEEAKASKLPF